MRRLYVLAALLGASCLFLGLIFSAQGDSPGAEVGMSRIVVQNAGLGEAHVLPQHLSEGQATTDTSIAIPPLHSVELPMSSLPRGWRGSTILSSDQPLAVANETTWSDGTYGDGNVTGAYSGLSAGCTELCLPYVVESERTFSAITVQNVSDETAHISMAYHNAHGMGCQSRTDDLEPGCAKTYDLSKPSDAANEVPDLPRPWAGALCIRSNREIAAIANTNSRRWSNMYIAQCSAARRLYFPDIGLSRSSDGKPIRRSVILLHNPSPDTDAVCKIVFYDRFGKRTRGLSRTIRSHSVETLNTASPLLQGSWGNTFHGSAVVHCREGSVVGLHQTSWLTGVGATDYAALVTGSKSLYAPSLRRVKTDGGRWDSYAQIIVQNVSNESARVTLHVYGRGAGTDVGPLQYWIPPLASKLIDVRHRDFASLENSWAGSAHLTSDQHIAGVVYLAWKSGAAHYQASSGP